MCVVLLVAMPATVPLSRISVAGHRFVDESGRVRIFHGFSDIGPGKGTGPFTGANYLPGTLLSNLSLTSTLINEYGFNCFRIPAMWAAVQPAPNTTDSRYLAALLNATRLLADRGAYSILDMHQDGLSSLFGAYDGAPAWLVNRTLPRHAYPWPFKPGHVTDASMTEAAGQAYQEIYDDTHGGLRAWAAAWAAFAEAFRAEPSVLAYELLNEPFPGDVYADPLRFLPGVAGSQSLQGAYDAVAAAIRIVDDHTIVMHIQRESNS